MQPPSCIIIDARNVERFTSSTQHLQQPACRRERDGKMLEQLRQTSQLRLCFEKLRQRFPHTQIDIFVCQQHYLRVQDDENLEAIRNGDALTFQKVPGGQDVDRMILARALDVEGSVILSNDLFRDHISSGLVSKLWVEEHVWGFMFARGDLVLPQLATPLQGQVARDDKRMRHLRSDRATTGTGLRARPDAASPPLLDVTVTEGEEVSIVAEQSEQICGVPTTWAKVSSAAGHGWLCKSHLVPLLESGQKMLHVRADNADGPTALRREPDLFSQPVSTLVALPKEEVVILHESICWVNISCAAGQGWLKRIHLNIDDGVEPSAKKQRREPYNYVNRKDVRHFHVKSLGYGDSADPHVQTLKSLLALHGMSVQHLSVGERPQALGGNSPSLAEASEVCDAVGKVVHGQSGMPASTGAPVSPVLMGPPPLARWYLRDVAVEGPQESLQALHEGSLRICVDGISLVFSLPLDPNSKRRGRGPTAYVERPAPTPARGVAHDRCARSAHGNALQSSIVPGSSQVPHPPRFKMEPPSSQVPRARHALQSSIVPGSSQVPHPPQFKMEPPSSQAPPRARQVSSVDDVPCSQVPGASLQCPSLVADVPCSQAW